MSAIASKVLVGVALHASATDWTTAPAAGDHKHLLLESHNLHSPDTLKVRRVADNPQNVGHPPFRGPVDVSKAYQLEMILRGLSGNSGGAIDPDSTTDCTRFLDALFGTASIDPAGAAATATGGTGASKILGVDEQARFPIGTVVRFTTDAGTFVRQVRARAGASGAGNLTLDRTFTGTVSAATVVRAARWKDDPAVYEHTHLSLIAEYTGHLRRLFIGGMGNWELNFARGKEGRLIVSNLRFTDIQDEANASPSYSAPTVGGAISRVGNKMWFGDDNYYATDIRVVGGGDVVGRGVDDSPQGQHLGFTCQKGGAAARTRLMAKLLLGTNTSEVADSTGTLSANKAQAWDKSVGDELATWDVAFQAGAAAGAFSYGVMRAGVITKAETVVVDGKLWKDVEIEATGSDTDLAPFEFHIG